MIQTRYSRFVNNTTVVSGGIRCEHSFHKWSLSAPNSVRHPGDVCVQLLILLISKRGFLAEYFPQSYSDVGPPRGAVRAHSPVIMAKIAFYQVLFFCSHAPFSSSPLLAPHRCSYRFPTQALVVLQRRSHRMSRLLTSE